MIVNAAALVTVPPSGFVMVTVYVPAVAAEPVTEFVGLTNTFSSVDEVNELAPCVPVETLPEVKAPVVAALASVVPSTVLVKLTVAPVTKPVPVMVTVVAAEPVVSVVGVSDV